MKPEQVAFDTQLEDMRNDYQDAMQGGSGASGLASAYADRALYRIAFLPSALEAASRKISLAELDSFAKAVPLDNPHPHPRPHLHPHPHPPPHPNPNPNPTPNPNQVYWQGSKTWHAGVVRAAAPLRGAGYFVVQYDTQGDRTEHYP